MQKKNNKMSQFFILPFFAFKTKSSVFHLNFNTLKDNQSFSKALKSVKKYFDLYLRNKNYSVPDTVHEPSSTHIDYLKTLPVAENPLTNYLSLFFKENFGLFLGAGITTHSSIISSTITHNFLKNRPIAKGLEKISKSINKKSLIEKTLKNTFYNKHIYADKVNEQKESHKISYRCRHFYLNVRKGDIFLVTTNLPDLYLSTGMSGEVTEILGHQEVELTFVLTLNEASPWEKRKLEKSKVCFVKETKNNLKNLF